MRLLTRYLIRQNLFLLFIILVISTGIYLLTDFFERIDDIFEAQISFQRVFWYFLVKTPLIISQLLPAIFLIATIVQMNILQRNRELLAMQAGGISPIALVIFIIGYSVFWAGCQLVFSQFLGVEGNRIATSIWKNEIRETGGSDHALNNLWISHKNKIIFIQSASPENGSGTGIHLYETDDSGSKLERIIMAPSFTIEPRQWILHNATVASPAMVKNEQVANFSLPIRQDLKVFLTIDAKALPEHLPLWELRQTIKQLQKSGSNVEKLETAFHAKISYALSIVTMGLIALVISRNTTNIYKAIGIALCMVFVFYSCNTICINMGEAGKLPPVVSAWLSESFMNTLCLGWLFWPVMQGFFARNKKTLPTA